MARDPMGTVDSWNTLQPLLGNPVRSTDVFGLETAQHPRPCRPGCTPAKDDCECKFVWEKMLEDMNRGVDNVEGTVSPETKRKLDNLMGKLNRVSTNCGPCENAAGSAPIPNPAPTVLNIPRRWGITICYYIFSQGPISGPVSVPGVSECRPCSSVPCDTLLKHELVHVICLIKNNDDITACMHDDADNKEWTDIGEQIVNCLTNPSDQCVQQAARAFRDRP